MKTQCDRLLSRLERGPVTPLTAWVELGIERLAARVYDLRKDGYKIAKQMVEVINQFGESCRVASYRLEK